MSRTLYVSNADRARLVWMAYPVRLDGTLGPGRTLYDGTRSLAGRRGTADGMKVDAGGHLFGAGPGGVYVFAPDGSMLGWFDFGGNVGNVAWGEDGSTLFIAANAAVYRVRLATRGAGWPEMTRCAADQPAARSMASSASRLSWSRPTVATARMRPSRRNRTAQSC